MNALTHHDFETAVAAAPLAYAKPNQAGRVFDLPPALHIATFAGFFLYLGIMWAAFATAELILPFAIFVTFLAAAFIVPALWARIAEAPGPKDGLAEFMHNGFECETGHIGGGAALVQVLIMPVMLVGWGLVIALIRASV